MIQHERGPQHQPKEPDSTKDDVPMPPDDPARRHAPVEEPPSREAPKRADDLGTNT